jgi:hypothetical protein
MGIFYKRGHKPQCLHRGSNPCCPISNSYNVVLSTRLHRPKMLEMAIVKHNFIMSIAVLVHSTIVLCLLPCWCILQFYYIYCRVSAFYNFIISIVVLVHSTIGVSVHLKKNLSLKSQQLSLFLRSLMVLILLLCVFVLFNIFFDLLWFCLRLHCKLFDNFNIRFLFVQETLLIFL